MQKKRLIIQLLIFISIVSLLACAGSNQGYTKSTCRIVTADGHIIPINGFEQQLDRAIQSISSSDTCDNLILFIHGRGKHPDKAFRQRLLVDLEADYSARVIMFHWPSWNGLLAFPESQARDAANEFIEVLQCLDQYQREHAAEIKHIRVTLLTQSMGSLVLEESTLRTANTPLPQLFDTVIIGAPASSAADHAQWIDHLSLSENIYITLHRHDPVLGPAGIKKNACRLGKGLYQNGKPVPLSQQANYVDVTKALVFHRYYLHRYVHHVPALKAFYDQVLNGYPATLTPEKKFVSRNQDQVYTLVR